MFLKIYHYNLASLYNLLYNFFFNQNSLEHFICWVVINNQLATGCLPVSGKPKMCRLEIKFSNLKRERKVQHGLLHGNRYVVFYITVYVLLILFFKSMSMNLQCLRPQKDIKGKKSGSLAVYFIMQGRLSQGMPEFPETS